MKSFKLFIKESTAVITGGEMQDLDMNFINNALKITSFNLTASDFTSLTHKREIQHLFNLHFFPKFDVSKTVNSLNKETLNTLIASLKKENMEGFKKIHNYNLKGVGPGEVTLYFLIGNCKLGGGSSAGIDAIIGTIGYEVKAVKVTTDGTFVDFKLGGTVPLFDIINDLNEIRTNYNLGGTKTEMKGSIIDDMKIKAPKEFAVIEQKYAKIAYDNYFKNHDVIFINNNPTQKLGNIESVKKVRMDEIFIERVTSGTVKPKIKI